MNKTNTETNYLYWINPKTKKRYSAGVAFYEEDQGEYRLKIDSQKEKRFYLKSVGLKDGDIVYRLEELIKRKGCKLRIEQGEGFSKKSKPETIIIEMAPCFSAILALEIKRNA